MNIILIILKGEALEIITRIREEYRSGRISRVADYHFNLEKFEYVRGHRIVYRLVNYQKNKGVSEDCPHLRLYHTGTDFSVGGA